MFDDVRATVPRDAFVVATRDDAEPRAFTARPDCASDVRTAVGVVVVRTRTADEVVRFVALSRRALPLADVAPRDDGRDDAASDVVRSGLPRCATPRSGADATTVSVVLDGTMCEITTRPDANTPGKITTNNNEITEINRSIYDITSSLIINTVEKMP